MSNSKLSICIATRNRAAFIGETLESIISQATDEIEIIILDGASTDNTEDVVRQYQLGFPNLRYFRQEINNGVDRDYSRTIELAQGEYCWFMTDDDVFKPGAIQTILGYIQQGYDLIIVNTESRTVDLSAVLEKQHLQIKQDRVYAPGDNQALFVDTAQHLSFIAAVVIKKDLWDARDKQSYFGTLFAHVGVIFQKPIPNKTLVIAEPLIANRRGNVSWASRAFEVWLFKWPDLIWSFSQYPDVAKRRVTSREPWRKLAVLLMFRGTGTYSIVAYQHWLEPCLKPGLYKVLARIVASLPTVGMGLLLVAYLFVFRPKERGLIYEVLKGPLSKIGGRILLPMLNVRA